MHAASETPRTEEVQSRTTVMHMKKGHILAMKENAGLQALTLGVKVGALFLTGEMKYMPDPLAKEHITWSVISCHGPTTSYVYVFYPRVQSWLLVLLLTLVTTFISKQLFWQQNGIFPPKHPCN